MQDFAFRTSTTDGCAIDVAAPPERLVYATAKRTFDITFALLVLILSTPVWLVAAVLIRLTSPGPIIFRQVRCGKSGRQFVCYKFRTMVADAEAQKAAVEHLNEMSGPVFKTRNDPRITAIGRWLRKSSIDELPQIINVLKGDMSWVGPRPPLPDEVSQYGPREWQRLSVTPGITCIWQVSGRSLLDFDQWVVLDLAYIQRRGFWYDLRLIAQTVPAVFLARGAL
jgi:lipopolysaccharide/colanic/teichoic acid biosynthesis glycosyltransferase